jgi:hypothetical protein
MVLKKGHIAALFLALAGVIAFDVYYFLPKMRKPPRAERPARVRRTVGPRRTQFGIGGSRRRAEEPREVDLGALLQEFHGIAEDTLPGDPAELRNPFLALAAAAERPTLEREEAPSEEVRLDPGDYRLTAIFDGGDQGRVAVIDGRVCRRGERIGEARVAEITPRGVWLARGEERIFLALFPARDNMTIRARKRTEPED